MSSRSNCDRMERERSSGSNYENTCVTDVSACHPRKFVTTDCNVSQQILFQNQRPHDNVWTMACLENPRGRITRIDCHVLLVRDYESEACSSAQDDLVVVIHTDEGIVGIGDTDTNPWVARECIR